MNRSKLLSVILILTVLLVIGMMLLDRYCPASGLALSPSRREVHRLKNRTSFPQPSDFDPQVNLTNLLQGGPDYTRWLQTKAARVEGYVVSVGRAGIELTNCWSPCRRDIHINLALQMNAPPTQQLVIEVTPAFERWASTRGLDWSAEQLKQTLVGHWCRFEGWLFFDPGHATEATNTFEAGSEIWRATAWELHPVTHIEVLH